MCNGTVPIQSGREIWLVDAAATPSLEDGATASNDGEARTAPRVGSSRREGTKE
ncbi:hypothetical protein HD598_001241 [Neomicrococcus aestuarii]|uniref:Uncharacterized protein n=1 Tax=Neomicrococcus aestuarii TaxID=556325 RepID=A0A7W8X199_9MICC|nr:hypothetical protein [Neomicrococcus aestuarii]